MSQKTLGSLKASFEELPFHQLLETDTTKMTDDEKRVLVEVLQERRQCAQKRRSVQKKESDKISGKPTKGVDISKFL